MKRPNETLHFLALAAALGAAACTESNSSPPDSGTLPTEDSSVPTTDGGMTDGSVVIPPGEHENLLTNGSFEGAGIAGSYDAGVTFGEAWVVVAATDKAVVTARGDAPDGDNVFHFSALSGAFGENRIDTCAAIDADKALAFSYQVFLDVETVTDDLRVRVNPKFYASEGDCLEGETNVGADDIEWGDLDWDIRGEAAGIAPRTWTLVNAGTHNKTGPMYYPEGAIPEGASHVRLSLRMRDDSAGAGRTIFIDDVQLIQPEETMMPPVGDGGVDDGGTEIDGGVDDGGTETDGGEGPGLPSLEDPETNFVAYAGGVYAQDFDGLPLSADSSADVAETLAGSKGPFSFDALESLEATGLVGWAIANTEAGSAEAVEVRAHDGRRSGGSGRGVISYGTDGSSERALGTLATGNQVNRFGVRLRNQTGDIIESAKVSFVIEQWRRGAEGDLNTLTFRYGVGGSINDEALVVDADLSAETLNTQADPTEVALDGNDAENRRVFEKTLEGLDWAPGEDLILSFTGIDRSGQDDGLAIDDFTFEAVIEGAPSNLLTDGSFEGLDGEYAAGDALGAWAVVAAADGLVVASAEALGLVEAAEGASVLYFEALTDGFGVNRIDTCVAIDGTKPLSFGFQVRPEFTGETEHLALALRVNPNFFADLGACEAAIANNDNTGRLSGGWNNKDWDVALDAQNAPSGAWSTIAENAEESFVYPFAQLPESAGAVRISVRVRDRMGHSSFPSPEGDVPGPHRRLYLDDVRVTQPAN